ncbi:MAG TPA: methionine--tRNA ligase subunit beta [Candidatus Korarchaeota archaeon]|nr:methionine--tRNA ligase subunit beta [Candidatus Korarchaeota archaeon]
MEFVSYEEFSKLDLRVGQVLSAKRIEGTQKLLLLEVDLGSEKKQLVAGIAEQYKPEDLVGKQIVVVANLQPKKIRGYWSQGMLLAADVDGKPVLLVPDKPVPPGSKVL